jgi:hypothetical protein
MSGVEKYALIQHEVLFLALYIVALYFVATRVGIGTAVLVFGGGLLVTLAGAVVGIKRRRNRSK